MIRVSRNSPYHNLDLESCSYFSEEKEVLLFPNFYFEVVRIKRKRRHTFIELKEIAHQNILSLKKLEFPKIVWVSETFDAKMSKKVKKCHKKEDLDLLRKISTGYGGINVQTSGSVG